MPARFAAGLQGLGIVYGLALILFSKPWRPASSVNRSIIDALVLGGVVCGALLLLGVVSGVYRYCPACAVVWSAVVVAALTIVARGEKAARTMSLALVALVLAAAWTRFDRVTSQGVAALLPRVELTNGCIADVLSKDDVRTIHDLGVPEDVSVIFVAHCSPCAATGVARLLKVAPNRPVVSPDATLRRLAPTARLFVYPPLAARAEKLNANLYEATLSHGELRKCLSNVDRVHPN